MTVYLDVIFLFNFLIDAAVLQTTAWSRKLRVKKRKIFFGALIGAVYVVMLFFPPLSFLFTVLVKCLVSLLMIFVSFGFGSLQHFLRNILAFYFVNFVVAGGIFAVHYLWQSNSEILNGIWMIESGYPVQTGLLTIALSLALMIWFFRQQWRSRKNREQLASLLAEVRVHIGEVTCSCTGLIDTGNQLYDPLTRTPVMIMEAEKWEDVLPPGWIRQLSHEEVHAVIEALDSEPFIWQDRLRIVPFSGIHRGTKFMMALKPDKVVIVSEQGQMETSKVLIGLRSGSLSPDGAYQAIIHPHLLEHGFST